MRRAAALGTSGLVLLAACAGDPSPPPRAAASEDLEPRPDWSADLPQLMPAVTACLAHVEDGARPVGVTKAWPMGFGLVGVRLLEPDESRVDCVAAVDGARVLLTEHVHPGSRLQGERDPLFTPATREPPKSPCLESSRVDQGWLSYDICRTPRPLGPAASRPPTRPRSGREEG